ncbi:MAG: glycosyltransferase, partial [Candidatus Omnitrophica bacterium]|nr:glycosyltransferase [Candidatus Omnitrophota bacterium]
MRSLNRKPDVSVIVVNYNGKKYLKECFSHLSDVDYPKKKGFEVLMVDNGSRDGSVDFVRKNFKNVRILKNDQNNYCSANNLGIKESKGRFVALLNNDTSVHPEWLKGLTEVMLSNDDVGIVGSKILFKKGEIQSAGHSKLPDFYWADRGFKEKDKGQYDESSEVDSVSGCSALYRRKMLKEIGFLDEDFVMYMEDVDICERSRKAGWKVFYSSKSSLYHKHRGTSGLGDDGMARFFLERNRLLFIAKHYPTKLGDSLFGKGYFTIDSHRQGEFKDINIFDILPNIINSAMKYNKDIQKDKILGDVIENLKKILNYEKSYLVQNFEKIEEKNNTLECVISEKDDLIRKKDSLLQDMEKHQIVLDSEKSRYEEKLSFLDSEIIRLEGMIDSQKNIISEKDSIVDERNTVISEKDDLIRKKDSLLQDMEKHQIVLDSEKSRYEEKLSF